MSKWWQQNNEDILHAEWQELQTPEGLTYFFNNRSGETTWNRPAELMTAEHETQAGKWLWMSDEFDCFVPVKVEDENGPKTTLRTQDGRMMTLKNTIVNRMIPLEWSSLQRIVSDLTLLDDMSPPLILHNLKQRFTRDNIYTNVGTILISINPYKRLPLYGADMVEEYENRGLKDMPPHVFNIAHQALKGIADSSDNQSIVVSGESGAGKTEATKQVLSYVAAVSGSVDNVEEKILLSNPILETFGNAKTVRNNNSSRFGKYIEVFINRSGELCASKTTNFLLEKVRVAQPAEQERNFHIFYQLCESSSEEQRMHLGLGRARDYAFLASSDCSPVQGIDDAQDFADMLAAMSAIGFSEDNINAILETTAAILHLGNVCFTETGERQCSVKNPNSLQWAAGLLQVDYKSLLACMTSTTLRINRQADTHRSLGTDEANECRDALAKFIYAAMFDNIVATINMSMQLHANDAKDVRHIGILDIFGFEVFQFNSFEQLCINYTNENLQQFFNANTFKLEEQLYESEGIQFDHVDFIDNQPMVDLLTGHPAGIMRLLDDEVKIPRGSDTKFLNKIIEEHKNHPNFFCGTSSASSFAIRHYAGDVVYDSHGFLEKNRDTLTQDQLSVLKHSSSPLIKILFAETVKMSGSERKKTLGRQFRTQLDELLQTLYLTQPHYIRCIKPNDTKSASTFLSTMCFEQLTFSGVFEAVKIRKHGFPFRQKHQDFIERYGTIFPDKHAAYKHQGGLSGCQELLADLQLDYGNVRMGKSMILYRSEEYKTLELKRSICVRKDEIVGVLTDLIDINPMLFDEEVKREKYFERLSKAVRTANEFNLINPTVLRARELLVHFIESRMDDTTKSMLENARLQMEPNQLREGLARADELQYSTKLVRECRKLLHRIDMIEAEVELASYTLDDIHMRVVCDAAEQIKLHNNMIVYFNTLLYETSEKQRLKIQLKRAVEMSNQSRAIRLTIKMKDSIFKENASLFDFKQCAIIKSPEDWAAEKFMCLSRDKLRSSMLTHCSGDIHSSLTHLPTNGKEEQRMATLAFRSIQAHCGDRTTKQPFVEGYSVVTLGHRRCDMRDEIYVQLLKQLSSNPQASSVRAGWLLLGACIASFPPNEGFANFLEVWLRENAQSREYIGALHNLCYMGARPRPIEHSSLASHNVAQVLRHLTDEYAEPLPSGKPSWEELTIPFDSTVDELEFKRSAPRHSRCLMTKTFDQVHNPPGQSICYKEEEPYIKQTPFAHQNVYLSPRSHLKPHSAKTQVWQAILDEESGAVYYWNDETGESSWEQPVEMKFGVTDTVRARF